MIDYMLAEAIAVKANKEDEEVRKKMEREREVEAWKKDTSRLDALR